jgi:hypothetical protein
MAGNANSGSHKDRLFRNALIMQLKVRDAGEDMKTLRAIADKLIDGAASGDLPQIKELSDRIDGKPAQQVDIANANGEDFKVKATIERIIVDPSNPNSAGIPAASETKPV